MKKIEIISGILLLMFLLFNSCNQESLHSGSLIFVASENSDFEKSIAVVTKSDEKRLGLTHVGIINVTDSGVFVVEAVPERGVVYTSLQEFKERNKNSVLYTATLKPEYQKYGQAAMNRACSHLGKGYDYAFDLENDLYYCSELVYDAYAHATRDPVFFETPPMTFKKEEADDILPYWIEYFEKLQLPIPEGKLGINPTGLSRSEKLKIEN